MAVPPGRAAELHNRLPTIHTSPARTTYSLNFRARLVDVATILGSARLLGHQLHRYRPCASRLLRFQSKMSSTSEQGTAKPMSEKQRLKLEKFANKKAKQAQQQQQQQSAGGTKKEKSKKPEGPTVSSKDWVEETPDGHKKLLKPFDGDFHKAYLPAVVESAWYSYWQQQGLFKPQMEKDGKVKPKGSYVIAIPPPNVRSQVL